MTIKIPSTQGYTLIEVMIALTVFAVGILAVAAMQLKAITSNSSSMKRTTASILAAQKIEEFIYTNSTATTLTDRDVDGTGGLSDATLATADWNSTENVTGGIGDETYNIFWNVADSGNSKNIRVIVKWDESGREHQVSLDYEKGQ